MANAKKKGAVSVLLDYSGNSALSAEEIDSITDKALARKGMKHALVLYPDGSFRVITRK